MEQKIPARTLEFVLKKSMLHNVVPSYLALLDIRKIILDEQMGDLSKYIEIKRLVERLEDSMSEYYSKKSDAAE